MHRVSSFVAVAVAVAVLGFSLFATDSEAQITRRVSVASDGTEAEVGALFPSISGDGRFVTFFSWSTNLVPADTNGTRDIFLHDTNTGTTVRVSVSSAEAQANGQSLNDQISADGRFVVFTSDASNLVPGDTNLSDVFVRDLVAGTTERVSLATSGAQANGNCGSGGNAITPDGRFVAFTGLATNLVAGDTNAISDLFVRDRSTGTTERVSVSSGGAQANGLSTVPSFSADGRYVAFGSVATNLVVGDTNGSYDQFVRDRVTGATERVSLADDDSQGNGASTECSISADGRYVVFTSAATNLVPGDSNGVMDVFVRDRVAGTTERVSVSSSEAQSNDESRTATFSADGRFVTFSSRASNLVAGDTNGAYDVFVRDLTAGTTELVSLTSLDEPSDDNALSADSQNISADGRYVAFSAYASNLDEDDFNFEIDVFVRDRRPCAAGNVNEGGGPVTDVLFVNGETRSERVASGTGIEIKLETAPAGPNPASYVLYLTLAARSGAFDLTVGPDLVGCTVNPTPFDAGVTPQPFKCLKGGFGPEYAGSVKVMNISPASAPWTRGKLTGFGRPIVMTLQGVIEDAASPSGKSVTNAVTLEVQ